MVKRLRSLLHSYPNQFWLMFVGMLISTIGASMIWPFLMIYVSKRLNSPMTITASLLTWNAMVGLIASFLGGPLLDRIGRKWIMVFSLAANGAAYIFLGHASVFSQFALLLGITGAVNPLYRSGADTMMADLVPPERRADAYSLMRLSNNLGISVGPLIGGFIATTSYTLVFYCAAAGMMLYSLLMLLLGKETLPVRQANEAESNFKREAFGGYPFILRDSRFMSFIAIFTLVSVCAVLMWTIMPVYANRNFQVPENVYRWIPATNAMMVVLFQQLVTQITKRYAPLRALAVGAFFYAIAAGGVALATHFWGFWMCMVVMTIGELILAPTSSTYTANLAPADKRGRYMSLYGLTWPVGAGIGPIFGGLLNDTLSPQATWYGGMAVGLVGAVIFAMMGRHISSMQGLTTHTSTTD
jgi:MFS family permease